MALTLPEHPAGEAGGQFQHDCIVLLNAGMETQASAEGAPQLHIQPTIMLLSVQPMLPQSCLLTGRTLDDTEQSSRTMIA